MFSVAHHPSHPAFSNTLSGGKIMSEPVKELHQDLFGGLHDFHVERTTAWIEAVRQELGDEVLVLLREKGADLYGLYRWHIERTLSWIDTLEGKYGSVVTDIVVNKQRMDRREQGAKLAKELGRNTLDDILPFFTHGNNENVIEKDNQHALVKATGCLAGKIAYDIKRPELMYALHCNSDNDFVEDFNPNLGCEVLQTLMDGHECCIHRIYVKEN